MPTIPTKMSLSPARQRLIELMQTIYFGRIENLSIDNRDPVFDPNTIIIREVKFGGDNQPHPEANHSDFRLKTQVIDLCQELDRLGNGKILILEVKHGLPFRMLLTQPLP